MTSPGRSGEGRKARSALSTAAMSDLQRLGQEYDGEADDLLADANGRYSSVQLDEIKQRERRMKRINAVLSRLEEAAEAATPGDWHRTHGLIASAVYNRDERGLIESTDRYVVASTDVANERLLGHEPDVARAFANARWITAANPKGVIALIADIRAALAHPAQARDEMPAECPNSPSGKHQIDTSMEEGPHHCFYCGTNMRAALSSDKGEEM